MIRAGIIGTGRAEGPGRFAGIARFHLNGYRHIPDVKLTGFYDAIAENARGWAEQYGVADVPVYERLEDLLANVDVVSICTPNNSHVELALKALRTGVAVLCEKPIGLTYAEAVEAAKAADATGTPHMVNFSSRRAPAVQFLKHLVDGGKLGELYWARWQYSADRHADGSAVYEWRFDRSVSGWGALADMSVHCIDMIRYLFGEAGEFEAVSGAMRTTFRSRPLRSGGEAEVTNDDTTVFTGELKGGALVSITGSRVGSGGWMQIELCGSGGGVRYDGAHPGRVQLRLKPLNGSYESGWEWVDLPGQFELTRPSVFVQNPVEAAVDEIVAAVRERRRPEPDFFAGAAAQRVVDAVALAAEAGRRVRVDEIG